MERLHFNTGSWVVLREMTRDIPLRLHVEFDFARSFFFAGCASTTEKMPRFWYAKPVQTYTLHFRLPSNAIMVGALSTVVFASRRTSGSITDRKRTGGLTLVFFQSIA